MEAFGLYPSLKGRCVFVTGGATGIGASMVRAFARQGMRIGFVDIDDAAGPALASELNANGNSVCFSKVDVAEISALQAAIAKFERGFGPVDVLVNNVANDTRHDWRDLTPDQWDKTMAVNLRPAFFAIQAVAGGMIDRKQGSIINFGSISWKAKHDGMPAYTSAKAAIHGLTRSFVKPLGAAGVRINTVMPGWVMTERQLREHFDEESGTILAENQPLAGRISADDAAAMAVFLAAADSAMCTGQEFTIDGGWT